MFFFVKERDTPQICELFFDLRYRKKEQKREVDSARWFYRDKTSFETKYGEECGRNGEEPAWVSDGGKGAESARPQNPQAHHQEPRQPKGIYMLACEIAARHPKEWELARQKYVRDLNDLTRLFIGQALTR